MPHLQCRRRPEKLIAEALQLESPFDQHGAHELDRLRIGRVQEEHRRPGAGVEFLLAHPAQQVAHRHRDVAEVDIDGTRRFALVAHGAVIGDVGKLVPVLDRNAAPRLLLVQERFDQQRRRQNLVARRIQQVRTRHVRRAHRLALAAAQAILDRIGNARDVALLHDQRLVAHQAEAGRVGVATCRRRASACPC